MSTTLCPWICPTCNYDNWPDYEELREAKDGDIGVCEGCGYEFVFRIEKTITPSSLSNDPPLSFRLGNLGSLVQPK